MASPATPAMVVLSVGNYHAWAAKVKAKITLGGAWECIDPGWNQPTITKPGSPTKEERSEQRDWSKSQGLALGAILESVSDANLRIIEGKTGQEAWVALQAHHNKSTSNRQYQLLQELASIRQKPKETLTAYFARIQIAGDRLSGSIVSTTKISDFIDMLQAMYALQNVHSSDENDSFTRLIKSAGTITAISIADAFTNEDISRSTTAIVETSEAAKVSREQGKGGRFVKPKANTGSLVVCIHCANSHESSECWKKFPEKKPEAFRKQDEERRAKAKAKAGKARETAARVASAPKDEDSESDDHESAYMASRHNPSLPPTEADHAWNTDTGATSHMTPNRSWIRNMTPCHIPVHVANDDVVYALGRGEVVFQPEIEGVKAPSVILSRVLYVPALSNNLLAVLPMVRNCGVTVHMAADKMVFKAEGKIILTASYRNKAAWLDGHTIPASEAAMATSTPLTRHLLHRRLAHIGKDRLERLIKGDMAKGIEITTKKDVPIPQFCEPCLAGKATRDPFPSTPPTSLKPLELITSDLHGPMAPTDEGFKYWVTFTDVATRMTWIYVLKRKSQAFEAFTEWKTMIEKQTGFTVKRLRDDKGGEFVGHKWEDYLKEHGILHEKTTVNTPQSNGFAERGNRKIEEGTTSLLAESKLPSACWAHAAGFIVRVMNCTPTSAIQGMTPFEAFYGKKPDLTMLRVFGCRAYVHIQKKYRKEAPWHMQKCVYFGFANEYKGYKCYNPETGQIIISRDVTFNEDEFPGIPWSDEDEPFVPISGDIPILPTPICKRL